MSTQLFSGWIDHAGRLCANAAKAKLFKLLKVRRQLEALRRVPMNVPLDDLLRPIKHFKGREE